MMRTVYNLLSWRLSATLLLSINVFSVHAQLYGSTDIRSLEALYSEHKDIGFALMTRASAEQATVLLHQWNKNATLEYQEIADSLDKYQKAFELIDAFAKGCYTVVNAYNSYEESRRYLEHIESSIRRFLDDCALRGDIETNDSIIVTALRDACNGIYDDGGELLKSLTDILAYATGKMSCTTRAFMTTLTTVNDGLYAIRQRLQRADYIIYHYVTLRTGWFKRPLYAARSLGEITDDSFGRWKEAAQRYGSYETRRYTYD